MAAQKNINPGEEPFQSRWVARCRRAHRELVKAADAHYGPGKNAVPTDFPRRAKDGEVSGLRYRRDR
jgi:hypothetical protein